jgi:hypothetical protein
MRRSALTRSNSPTMLESPPAFTAPLDLCHTPSVVRSVHLDATGHPLC